MLKNKKKIGSNMGSIKPGNRMLRLFRRDEGFATSVVGLSEEDQENVSEGYRKEIENAKLQTEILKAQTIMAFQNRRFY